MTTRTRSKKAAAGVAAQDEEIRHAVSDSEEAPEDLAAAAAEEDRQAEELLALVAEERAQDQARMAAIRERHAAELAEAEREVGQRGSVADRREREAHDRKQHAAALARAADLKAAAEEHEARAEDLAADLERVTGTIAGLDSRLAELGAERERLEVERATARSGGDPRTVAGLAPLVEATDETMADLGGQREQAQARAREIGDGTPTGPGELLDALTAAETHRAALTQALDELFPDRPGAEHRRDLGRLKGAIEGNLARIADEAKAAPPRRRFGFADAH